MRQTEKYLKMTFTDRRAKILILNRIEVLEGLKMTLKFISISPKVSRFVMFFFKQDFKLVKNINMNLSHKISSRRFLLYAFKFALNYFVFEVILLNFPNKN